MRVYVFNQAGQVVAPWPLVLPDPIWSSVAIGDLNHDGNSELVFGSNGNKFYAMHANGTQLIDGDSNPSTNGVFKVLGDLYNYGTPSLADLNGDGTTDIVYASFDKKVYAWKTDGTNLPGFPITTFRNFTSSTAVGYLDGPGDTQLDIVAVTGSRRPRTPAPTRCTCSAPTAAVTPASRSGSGERQRSRAVAGAGRHEQRRLRGHRGRRHQRRDLRLRSQRRHRRAVEQRPLRAVHRRRHREQPGGRRHRR